MMWMVDDNDRIAQPEVPEIVLDIEQTRASKNSGRNHVTRVWPSCSAPILARMCAD